MRSFEKKNAEREGEGERKRRETMDTVAGKRRNI